MILLLDAGNSRLKWAGLEAGRAIGEVSCAPVDQDVPPAEWTALPRPERVVAACVAGAAVERRIARWVHSLWDLPVEFVRTPAAGWGVRNGYAQPQRLGVDRWAALVGAYHAGLAPACILDLGTCVTVDVLCADGRHCGGWILPGRALMVETLTARAPGIRLDAEADSAASGLGRDTAGAVHAGVRAALLGVLGEALAHVREACGAMPVCVLTGGDAAWLAPAAQDAVLRPALVIEGLAVMAGRDPGEGR